MGITITGSRDHGIHRAVSQCHAAELLDQVHFRQFKGTTVYIDVCIYCLHIRCLQINFGLYVFTI